MSTTTAPVRVGRTYTRARRYPSVIGKLGDWVLWLGPYTYAQLTIAGGGTFLLIKTYSLWSWMGPVPPVALGFAIWLARASRIGGRSPLYVAAGWLQFTLQPSTGRIGGRTARAPRPSELGGSFLISTSSADATHAPPTPRARPPKRRVGASTGPRRRTAPASVRPTGPRPAPTPLQQLLRERQEASR
ncbi:hypothetical protein ACFRAO_43000 [Streptomyces sp. NPDC056656]|uniref:hypothetical protein n=1 Tax=Streptomyces sp. NPDC056656 TaxID=3345895 RepID=UPI00369BEC79